MEFAKEFCAIIFEKHYWADYIDPCSGLPVRFSILETETFLSITFYL